MDFYTYIWTREDGSPYYIGKGAGRRAFVNGSHNVRKPKDASRIQIISARDEQSAYETEKFLIAYYGRKDNRTGCLRNFSDGGENPLKLSPESIERRAAKLRGVPKSVEHRRKLSIANTGKKQSPETIAKKVAALTGRKRPEFGKKISIMQMGRVLSQETRDKISRAMTGKHWTRKKVA